MHEITAFERVIVMDAGRILMDDTPANIFARGEELRAVGLDVPMVTRLGHHMKAHGWGGLPEVVLTTDQLKQAVQPQENRSTAAERGFRREPIDRARHVVAPTINDDPGSGEDD